MTREDCDALGTLACSTVDGTPAIVSTILQAGDSLGLI